MTEMRDFKKGGMVLVEESQSSETPWFRKRRLIAIAVATASAFAIAVGTGVGVTQHNKSQVNNSDSETSPSDPTTIPTVNISTPANIWQPRAGATWDIQLKMPLNISTAPTYDIWDFDLFDNTKETINTMQSRGSKIVCYFSAGTHEDWRPDAGDFSKADLGSPMVDWPGETWLNVSSPNVRQIMLKRLDMAVSKNCDAVDPDNMDGYQNANGLNLTTQDAVDYVVFLAEAAHQRNMSIGLKNAGEIIPSVINVVQFSVNEACSEWNDCHLFSPMIEHNKPVFHIEYPKGSKTNNNLLVSADQKHKACNATGETGFSTVIKNSNLDSWTQLC